MMLRFRCRNYTLSICMHLTGYGEGKPSPFFFSIVNFRVLVYRDACHRARRSCYHDATIEHGTLARWAPPAFIKTFHTASPRSTRVIIARPTTRAFSKSRLGLRCWLLLV